MRKEHIDEAGFCKHCMATVDADGYAVAEQEQLTPYEGESTEQQDSTVAMRNNSGASFAEAVEKADRAGYAEGGAVKDPDDWIEMDPNMKIHRDDMAEADWPVAQAYAKTARQDKALADATPEVRRQFAEAKANERPYADVEMAKKKAERYGRIHRPGSRR